MLKTSNTLICLSGYVIIGKWQFVVISVKITIFILTHFGGIIKVSEFVKLYRMEDILNELYFDSR